MNLLHVISGIDPKLGGVSQGLITIAMGLEKEGVRNEIVTLDAPDASFLKGISITTHAIGKRTKVWGYHPMLIPWLKEHLARFDVVILHGLWLFQGYAVRKAIYHIRKRGGTESRKVPKVLIFPHGMLDPYFQRKPDRKLKAVRNYIYWKLIENKIIKNADGILFTCEQECMLARNSFHPYKPNREIVVGLGVEMPLVYNHEMMQRFREKCGDIEEQPYLLFLGRIHEKKGVDLLISAYEQVFHKTCSNADIDAKKNQSHGYTTIPKLVIAGPGLDSAYGKMLKNKVSSNNVLANSIFFPGMLDGPAKWGALYGCEAFVLPSHQENFGIAIVEAMACGKPVLISDQINIWKEISEAKGGMIAEDTLQGTTMLLKSWSKLCIQERKIMAQNAKNAYDEFYAIAPAAKRFLSALIKNNFFNF